MDKLTLDQTWIKCLKMWKWVVKHHHKNRDDVINLKYSYLKMCHIEPYQISNLCYFCNVAISAGYACENCPGKLVDPIFNCRNPKYNYCKKPEKFLAKLKQLNKQKRKDNCGTTRKNRD